MSDELKRQVDELKSGCEFLAGEWLKLLHEFNRLAITYGEQKHEIRNLKRQVEELRNARPRTDTMAVRMEQV